MDKSLIWLWLSLHFGAGTKVYNKLITYFEDEQNIYDTDDSDMAIIHWLTDSQKSKLLDKNLDHAYEILDWCEDNDVQIITYADEQYPQALREISNFPAVLYCKGTMPDFNENLSLSVVGTRSMTTYGQKIAFDLGYTLSKGGAIVVSGMARGIDATASFGTLNALGVTVVVLGSGIDVIYPRENASLMNKIIEYGAVITEFPPSTPPNARNFPIRNRIISGISNGTVVVEADLQSGAMIIAKLATEQRKPVFSVPGPVRTYTSTGTNQLIRDGAKMVSNAIDILEEFLEDYSEKIDISKAKVRPSFTKNILKVASNALDKKNFYDSYDKKLKKGKKETRKSARKFVELPSEEPEQTECDMSMFSEDDMVIYNAMESGKYMAIDDFVHLGYTVPQIGASLSTLEIYGAITSNAGGLYLKK